MESSDEIKLSIDASKSYICKYSNRFSYDVKINILEIIMKLDNYKKYIKTYKNPHKSTDIFLDELPNSTIIEVYNLLKSEEDTKIY